MEPIRITSEQCTRCKTCIGECPMGLFSLPADQPATVFAVDRQGFCLRCGHCEAVCPAGAIKVVDDRFAPSPYPLQAWPSAEALSALMRERRSIRKYKTDEVPRADIAAILDVVRFAPTASNGQIVQWIVYSQQELRRVSDLCREIMTRSAEQKDALSQVMPLAMFLRAWQVGYDPLFHRAPHLIVAHAPRASATAVIDSTIALAHFDLALPTYGLGGCWAGLFYLLVGYSLELRKELALPADNIMTGAMLFGYPDQRYIRIPKRKALAVDWR